MTLVTSRLVSCAVPILSVGPWHGESLLGRVYTVLDSARQQTNI